MKVIFSCLRRCLYPVSLLSYSLSHFHHWSWPQSRVSSCVPPPHRQTSDPVLNFRIIYHCHSPIYHCHRMTSVTPRSLSAHYLLIWIHFFFFFLSGWGASKWSRVLISGGKHDEWIWKWNMLRGKSRMTWDSTCQTPPQRPLPVFTANIGHFHGARDVKLHSSGYCSSWHQWHELSVHSTTLKGHLMTPPHKKTPIAQNR